MYCGCKRRVQVCRMTGTEQASGHGRNSGIRSLMTRVWAAGGRPQITRRSGATTCAELSIVYGVRRHIRYEDPHSAQPRWPTLFVLYGSEPPWLDQTWLHG